MTSLNRKRTVLPILKYGTKPRFIHSSMVRSVTWQMPATSFFVSKRSSPVASAWLRLLLLIAEKLAIYAKTFAETAKTASMSPTQEAVGGAWGPWGNLEMGLSGFSPTNQ